MKNRKYSKAYSILITLLLILIASSIYGQGEDFTRIGGWAEGPCKAVNSSGNVGYFGNGCILEVVDISDPENPISIARHETPSFIYDLAIQNDYLYIANNDLGLRILDISDPSNLVEIGFLEMQGFHSRVLPDGDIVYYFTNSSNGLYVVDVTTPSDPVELARVDIGDRGGMALAGDYLLVAARWQGCKIFDMTAPESPVEIAAIEDIYGYDVAVEENRAYISSGDSLIIIDISIPDHPVQIGTIFPDFSGFHTALVEDDIAYIVQYDRIIIVDVSDPDTPVRLASYHNPKGFIHEIYRMDHILFAACVFNGVNMIDVEHIESPQSVGSYDAAGHSGGIFVYDDVAWLANGWNGLRAFDVSEPENPIQLNQLDSIGYVYNVVIDGGYAYLAKTGNRLVILDISDVSDLKEAGELLTSNEIYDIDIQEDLAFLANNTGGLIIVDISDPEHLTEIGFLETEGRAFKVDVVDDYAYVADWNGGLRIIDISNPASPVETGFLQDIGFIHSVAVHGNYAYVGMSNPYVKVIDISDPVNPFFVSQYFTARAQDLLVHDEQLYVSAGYNGIFILDISDPTDLQRVGYYDTGGEVYETFIYDDNVYLADYTAGMTILHFGVVSSTEDPSADLNQLSVERIYPNPFQGQTTIEYTSNELGDVTLTIYDLNGHRIRILNNNQVSVGTYEVTWEGTNQAGIGVQPGLYLLKLQSQKERIVKPIILVRK